MSVFRPPDPQTAFNIFDWLKFANNIMTLAIMGIAALKQLRASRKLAKSKD